MNKVKDLPNWISYILITGIVLAVGTLLANNFSYNLSIQNNDKKWFIFIQHPIKFILNKGKLEK